MGSVSQVWRYITTATDPGANHTAGGSYAYRNAGPAPAATYSSNACAAAETPTLTVGASTINLTYWERHHLEMGGTVLLSSTAQRRSLDGCNGPEQPAGERLSGHGRHYGLGNAGPALARHRQTLALTLRLPAGHHRSGRAAALPAPIGPGAFTAYGRRCHLLTGFSAGDTVKFRWRFTSDPASEFAGSRILDYVAVTGILLPNSCTASTAPACDQRGVRLTHGAAGNFSASTFLSRPRASNLALAAGSGAARGYQASWCTSTSL